MESGRYMHEQMLGIESSCNIFARGYKNQAVRIKLGKENITARPSVLVKKDLNMIAKLKWVSNRTHGHLRLGDILFGIDWEKE